ncbi:metallophosphoesterase [Paracoccus caeni]|uniref:Metallophosphoesterase n=1 Tax=Paracoccus caeni TaxID=657651 RepID=A0A934VWA1_9RHOB|nr:metallophosphoesterase [Paracoccus caeni]MBK4217831.1 metallophosphoesterase [Paracoccus caeni]
MTRILHLSDLHFGFHRKELIGPLLDRINRARADIVVATGDLTHRGRPGQYEKAAEFLERITAPVMCVPGNHDVPLYNVPVRFLLPYSGYKQNISAELAPTMQSGQVRVLGLNSVDPFRVQRGVIREGQIGRVIGSLDPLSTNILALHHPLEQLPQVDKELSRRAPEALARLEQAGVHIVLSGHLHVWASDALLARTAHPKVLQIQVGTALCARLDDRQNEFAVLDIDGTELTVERHIAPMDQPDFQPPLIQRYSRASGIWEGFDQDSDIPILPGATETVFSTA